MSAANSLAAFLVAMAAVSTTTALAASSSQSSTKTSATSEKAPSGPSVAEMKAKTTSTNAKQELGATKTPNSEESKKPAATTAEKEAAAAPIVQKLAKLALFKAKPVSAVKAADAKAMEKHKKKKKAAAKKAGAAAAAAGGAESDSEGPSEDLKANIENRMPDREDPEIAAVIKCSSCAAVANEMFHRMSSVNSKALAKGYKKGAEDFEFVDAMEAGCNEINKEWGFGVRNDMVVGEYVPRARARYHIRSGWVASHLTARCNELTDAHESKLMTLARKRRDLNDFTELLCVVLDQSCAVVADNTDDSSDEPIDASTIEADAAVAAAAASSAEL